MGRALAVNNWRTSSYSAANGSCVEVGWVLTGHDSNLLGSEEAPVAVRDTKDRDGDALIVGGDAWRAFTSAIKDGRTTY